MNCLSHRLLCLGLALAAVGCAASTSEDDSPEGTGGKKAPTSSVGTGGKTNIASPNPGGGGSVPAGSGGSSGSGSAPSVDGAVAGPSRDGGVAPSIPDAGAFDPPGLAPSGGGIPAQAEVFDDSKLRTYAFTITPADLAKMDAEAAKYAMTGTESTVYIPATLVVDGEDVGKVGLRYKGAFGTLQACFDKAGKIKSECRKLSLRLKISEFEPEKRWKGIKGLNLHGLMRDSTLLHERLGYKLFRAMGIPAPRSVHAKVTVNGELRGLYAATELVDGRFTSDRFPKVGDGNLLKEVWPNSGKDDDYKGKLKTNEDMPKLPFKTRLFYSELEAAGNNAVALNAAVNKWMGQTYGLRYLAVDRSITNWDGITGFYCGGPNAQTCGNHNSFMYEAEKEDRVYLIPWDLDNTFSITTGFDNVPAWNNPPADCTARFPVWENKVMSPGCDRVFRGLAAGGKPAWQKVLGEFLDGPFVVDKMLADLNRWEAQIRETVIMDKSVSPTAWAAAVAEFKAALPILREKMQAEREGKVLEPFGLVTDKVNDLEGVAKASLLLGSSSLANGASIFTRSLNAVMPLGGLSDARADFEFRNDPNVMWAWGFLTLNMKGGAQNVSTFKQIRFRAKTNMDRGGRIELESPRNTVPGGGRLGWSAKFSAAGSTITLDLAKAAKPDWAAMAAGKLDEVVGNLGGISFQPDPNGQASNGFFPNNGNDKGWIQVDDIEFLK